MLGFVSAVVSSGGGASHQSTSGNNLPPLFEFSTDELRNLPSSVDISKLTINSPSVPQPGSSQNTGSSQQQAGAAGSSAGVNGQTSDNT